MKSVKNLIIPFIILVALIICVIVYYAVDTFKNSEPSETSSSGLDVIYYNLSDISSVSVNNRQSGNNSLVKCFADVDNNVVFEYLGDDADPGINYSQARLNEYVCNLIIYYGYFKVSSSGNYADFGLSDPLFTVVLKTINGNETTVYLGNTSPDGNYCYMYYDNSLDIYAVQVDKKFQAEKTAIDFLDTKVLDINPKDLKTVHFDRNSDNLSLDATVSVSDSGSVTYEIFKPYTHSVSSYFKKMIDSVSKLEITEYISIEPAELVSYGLNDPVYHFILSLNDGTKTEIFFSRKNGDYYYGYVKGNDNYFKISGNQVDGLDLNELVLIDPYICFCSVKDVSSITGTYGDSSFKFEFDVLDGKSIMDSTSSVKLNGRNAKITDSSGRSYCSILFESITCINIGGVETGASVNTSSGPALTLTFVGKNYATTVYEFYNRDSDSYYVFKNGEYMNFYVYSREIFNNGGTDTYNYGYWSAYELLSEAITENSNGIYDIA